MSDSIICCRIGSDWELEEVHVFTDSPLSSEGVNTRQAQIRSGDLDGALGFDVKDTTVRAAIQKLATVHDIIIQRDTSIAQLKAAICTVSPAAMIPSMYCYGGIVSSLTADAVYRSLKNANDGFVDANRLRNFVYDIGDAEKASSLGAGSELGYNDIVELGLGSANDYVVSRSIGQTFQTSYSMPANPKNSLEGDMART